jgi:hypothetical protein
MSVRNSGHERLTRRGFIGTVAAAAATAGIGLGRSAGAEQGAASKEGTKRPRCAPVISGNLRPFDPSLDRAGWVKQLDDERAIGFDLLWISHVAPAFAKPLAEDPMLTVLDLCAERKMQVIVDTGASPLWYGDLDLDKELKAIGASVKTIAERYGSHPAFHAWYVPHEIYMAWDSMNAYLRRLYPAVVSLCKEAVPAKPVTLSPFFILDRERVFGDFRFNEPEEYQAYWADLIRLSRFDIIMLQDSGEHFSFCTMEQRRPYFAAMRAACDTAGATLWANVETAEFECSSMEEYVRRYWRVHHSTVKAAPWRAVPIDRLKSKLELAAEYADRIVTWGYYQYGRPELSDKAAQWYRDYQAYVGTRPRP